MPQKHVYHRPLRANFLLLLFLYSSTKIGHKSLEKVILQRSITDPFCQLATQRS